MSVNKERRHVLVLPEDDANRQIANGFQAAVPFRNIRQLQILRESGGWTRVREDFLLDQVPDLERNENRFMVLVSYRFRRKERSPSDNQESNPRNPEESSFCHRSLESARATEIRVGFLRKNRSAACKGLR